MRQSVRIAAMVALVAWPLVGWAGEDNRTVVRFSFWGNFTDLEFWKTVAADFEAENPDLRIKLEYVTGDYGQKLPLLMVSETAADIILMDDELMPAYAARGHLENLAPYIERDREALGVDDFLPTSMQSFNYRGFQGGLPWDGLAMMIFYNKDLFDQAGIPYPSEDWTYDDFRAIAKRLTRDVDGDARIDQFGTNQNFAFLGIEPIIWSFGGDILDPERTHSVIDSPENLEAFQLLYDMKYKDHSIAWTGEMEGLLPEAQLLTGRVGMVYGGAFIIVVLESTKGGMRWGIAHVPKGPRGERRTRVSWDGISINAKTSLKEEAWRFIKFILTEPCQAFIGKTGRGIPVRREFALKYFVRPESQVDEELVLDAVQYGKLTPITPKFMELRQVIEDIGELLNTEYSTREWNRAKIEPAAALKRMEAEIDAVMAKELARWGDDATKNPPPPQSRLYDVAALSAIPALFLAIFLGALAASPRYRRTCAARFEVMRGIVRSRMGRQEALFGVLFASPWLIGVCVFTLFPICFSVLLSFSAWDPYDPIATRRFIGATNYVRAFTGDPLMWKALHNTFAYAIFAVPLGLAASLGLALLLNQRLRGITIFRTVFYVPSIVGGVATSILWLYIFNPVFGPLNGAIRVLNHLLDQSVVLAFVNLPEPGWIIDPGWAKPALIIMSLWGAGGAGMLIFLAGLQGVPDQLYEVADLDGAGRWRKFWNITLPMLTPTIYFNFIMGLIGSLQVFMQAFVMTEGRGGTDKSLLFCVLYLYQKAFIEYDMGYACALAWILFAIILCLTLLVVKSSAVWVYYEGEKGG